jgi:O-antigen ligase
MAVPINPLLGAGYQSFWLGRHTERLWEVYTFKPIQAHNGYLETYLNGGLAGLTLLLGMFLATGRRLGSEMLSGSAFATLRFNFFIVVLVYNWTEAMFSILSPLWLLLLLAAMDAAPLPAHGASVSSEYMLPQPAEPPFRGAT